MKQNIFGMSVPELSKALAGFSVPTYRAIQIAEWMYQKGTTDFGIMTNLPHTTRVMLDENFTVKLAKLLDRQDSKDGMTTKFLLQYPDEIAVETVLMRQSYGNSVCVSTQAGCSMGCVFCASTLDGMVRNLSQREIFAQVFYIDLLLRAEKMKVNTIVIMGSGEPMANYEAVLGFIRLSHEPYTLNLGYRNITLSTSGIVPMIERLSTEGLPITLSISLHASNDEIRSRLMPINHKYGVHEVVQSGRRYADRTGRRVTYEYILIKDINDSVKYAEELSDLLRGQLASVNLIPINPVVERGLNRPSVRQIEQFKATLEKRRITVTLRREMGNDIQAACGQLRNQHLAEKL